MLRKSLLLLVVFFGANALAHVGLHPSVHDTVASIVERMRVELPAEKLTRLTVEEAHAFLSEEERHILGTEHITFQVNVPILLSVIKDASQQGEPFWLEDRGFEKTALTLVIREKPFEVWQKAFEAGPVGLGVNSISGSGDHYFVTMKPRQPGAGLEVTDIYPGQHTLGVLRPGERVYVSWADHLAEAVPAELEGQVLLRGDMNKRRDAKLTDIFRMTRYPATAQADQVTLTWSDNPQKTQAIQWRTSTEVPAGAVRYQKKGDNEWREVQARTEVLDNISTVNDRTNHRHTANLRGLQPYTEYAYEVGTGEDDGWQPGGTFRTAPDATIPFTFVYMGDAQNGLDTWGKLVQKAHQDAPDAAFYVMAGDLVNRGNERDDWDDFFHNAKGVFDHKALVPTPGNHEYQGTQGPWMYLALFDLLKNGPDTIDKELAYSFTYSNSLFVVLDSNLLPEDQAEWLDQELARSDATWKFVIYHHPLYSSGPRRDNPELRDIWGSIFDKHHVDLALQGHDHAYLRTYPMKDQQRVDSPAEGTIYIISVSGTKMYEQKDHDYIEVGFTNVATYQLLDIQIDGNKLTYTSYDIEGEVRDTFVIEK